MVKRQESRVKVVLTGGHAATTALATAQAITKSYPSWQLFWIGSRKALEGRDVAATAFKVLPKYGVYYHPIVAGRFQRKWSRYTIVSLVKIPIGFFQAIIILIKIKPMVIVSFGGGGAFPVVVAGWLLGIPVVVHAQTIVVGLANRMSTFFASKIAVARPQSLELVPKDKAVLVGNPVLESITKVGPKEKIGTPPTIYITGGSTGSQNINKKIDEVLEVLLKDYFVIHQTGDLDWEHFKARKLALSSELQKRYEVHNFVDPSQVHKIYQKADFLISRAGANTISEILVTQRPAILIPHPWVVYDEQTKNAQEAVKSGIIKVIKEDELTSQLLVQKIKEVAYNWEKISAGYNGNLAELDRKAAYRLVDLISKEVK